MGRPVRRSGPIVVVVMVLVAAAAASSLFFAASRRRDRGPELGPRSSAPQPAAPQRRPAPGFTLPRLAGGQLRLQELRGRPVVLNFWASWCVPCRAEAPNLERAWQTYRARDVVLVGVDVQDAEDDAREFIAALKVSYPNVRDPTQHVLTAYRVTGIPTTVFIDREGRIQRRYAGAFTGEAGWKQLSTWIEDLLR